jgi:hypothetical protein
MVLHVNFANALPDALCLKYNLCPILLSYDFLRVSSNQMYLLPVYVPK